MRAALIFVLVAFLLGLLPGCASTPRSEAPVGSPAGSPVGAWLLVSFEGEPLPDPLPPGLRPITLTIADDGAVSGSAGVNRYSGSVETAPWANGEIEFGPLAVTRMAGPPAAMTVESTYLGALARVRTFEIVGTSSGGTLTLSGDAGEMLTYERAE